VRIGRWYAQSSPSWRPRTTARDHAALDRAKKVKHDRPVTPYRPDPNATSVDQKLTKAQAEIDRLKNAQLVKSIGQRVAEIVGLLVLVALLATSFGFVVASVVDCVVQSGFGSKMARDTFLGVSAVAGMVCAWVSIGGWAVHLAGCSRP
jgi:hypothetical protein